ncbi:MAG: DUF4276 family protein [Parcubacteria group bacterium]|nr:DUF4276 family protein [Parcubacteria group bacterium]
MRKIVLFVEGQTEAIFVRQLLMSCFDLNLLKITLQHLNSRSSSSYGYENPAATILVQIYICGGDEAVLGAIRKREKTLFEKGAVFVLGLRDAYSEAYENQATAHSDGNIDTVLIEKMRQLQAKEIKQMVNPERIELHFSIMEIEAWILAVDDIFENLDTTLTNNFILKELLFDLSGIDPESYFYKPSKNLDQIYKLVGRTYDKKKTTLESLISNINKTQFDSLASQPKAASFKNFYNVLRDVLS